MRTVILEFTGGAWAGRNLSNDTLDPFEACLAVQKYLATDNGQVGKTVPMLNECVREYLLLTGETAERSRGASEVYRVADRQEIGDDVLVRLECLSGNDATASGSDRRVG